MKETLKSMDKLQADLDQANAAKASLEAKAKAIADQVFELQRKIQVLQAQAIESHATGDKVIELENELKEAVARGGSLYMEAQDNVKELSVHFSGEDFSQINDILPEDEEDEEEGDNNLENLPGTKKNLVDVNDPIIETWKEDTKDLLLSDCK